VGVLELQLPAIGGLLFSLQPSQEVSFLHEKNIPVPVINNTRVVRNIFFMTYDFK